MSLLRSTEGAVFVETLVAIIVPVMFFFVTWQLVDLFTAQLILKHAAVAAARAAVVVGPDDRRFYGGEARDQFSDGGQRLGDVKRAAALVIGAAPNLVAFGVEIQGSPKDNNPITAVVKADYACHGGWLSYVCAGASTRRLTAEATLPYQGASFKYEGE